MLFGFVSAVINSPEFECREPLKPKGKTVLLSVRQDFSAGGGWGVAGGGWRVTGDGWRVTGSGWRVRGSG